MKEYMIYKLNNFIVVHRPDSPDSYVYDSSADMYLGDFDEDDEEMEDLNRLFEGKGADFFDQVEMKIEAVYAPSLESYLDNKSIDLYKRAIRYMIEEGDIGGVNTYLERIEDDYYPYLYIYSAKKIIEGHLSPYGLSGKLEANPQNSEIVMALSLSLIGRELNEYFNFFRDEFRLTEKYLQVIEMKNIEIISQFKAYAKDWLIFMEELAGMQKYQSKREAIEKYIDQLLSKFGDLSDDSSRDEIPSLPRLIEEFHGNIAFEDLLCKLIDQDYDKLYEAFLSVYTKILKSTYKVSEYKLIGDELDLIRKNYKLLYENLDEMLRAIYINRPRFIAILDKKERYHK